MALRSDVQAGVALPFEDRSLMFQVSGGVDKQVPLPRTLKY